MKPRLCFVGEGTVSDEIRLSLSGEILEQRGYPVVKDFTPLTDGSIQINGTFDIVILARPHVPEMIEQFKKAGVKVVVDQDDDFWHIPKDHVAYNGIGPGNPKSLARLEECLRMADLVTTPSPVLADLLRRYTPAPVELVPNGWSKANTAWKLPRSKQAGDWINFAWAGTITHRSDFLKYALYIRAFLEEHKNTRIVIGQDPEIYKHFSNLPEDRKLFLPPMPYRLYPLIFQYIDVWMAPLLDNPFNRAKSDIKLVDAGAKGIPWIASSLPAYCQWEVGGYLADSPTEWYQAMEAMLDPERRAYLGMEGNIKAEKREQEQITNIWEGLLGRLYG